MKVFPRVDGKLLSTFAILALLCSACRTVEEQEEPLSFSVIRVKGWARYSVGNDVWKSVKARDELWAGAVMQTAENSYADILLGYRPRSSHRQNLPRHIWFETPPNRIEPPTNRVRLLGNSVLVIDHLRTKELFRPRRSIEKIRFALLTGRIVIENDSLPADSVYEVRIPGAFASIGRGQSLIASEGIVAVLRGVVILTLSNTNQKITVPSGFQFDARTGETTALSPLHSGVE